MTSRTVGRYEILERIGQGGQSIAYKARDPKIERIVAIKQIRSTEEMPEKLKVEFRERFLREAKAAGRLSHPNIATIYDVGEDDKGVPYLAMEFVDGVNLDRLIATEHPLDKDRIIEIFCQLCSALGYAHDSEIVHRDIKPGNIMVTPKNQIKVVDFGIAKLSSSQLTEVGTAIGTPSYMSPEQIMGQTVDRRSDIFSAGVVLFETLTGECPFKGDSPTAIAFNIVHKSHTPAVEQHAMELEGFRGILNRALEKDPANRYQTCAQMKHDLESLRQQTMRMPVAPEQPTGYDSLESMRTLPLEGRGPVSEPAAVPPGSFLKATIKQWNIKTIGLVAAGIALAVTLLLLYVLSGASPAEPTPESGPLPEETMIVQTQDRTDPLLENARAAMTQGLMLGREGNDALHYVNEALALDPKSTEAAKLKVEIRAAAVKAADDQARSESPGRAVTIYDSLLVHFPGDEEIKSKKDTAQARLSRLTRASELNRVRTEGNKAFELGRYADAIRFFDDIVRLDPRDASAFYLLGRSHAGQGSLDIAIEHLTRAVDLDPSNPLYETYLGLALEQNRNYGPAYRHLQKAVELGGTSEYSVPALRARAAGLRLRAELAELTPYRTSTRHNHFLRGGCEGELTITDTTIRYAHKDHAFEAGLESLREFTVKKERLEVVLQEGKKYTFEMAETEILQKIAAVLQ